MIILQSITSANEQLCLVRVFDDEIEVGEITISNFGIVNCLDDLTINVVKRQEKKGYIACESIILDSIKNLSK